MTIYIDSTEASSSSSLPIIKDAKVVTCLEELTGADLLISPLTMPCTTPVLISKHIAAGAVLVQRKSGEDLVRSIGVRILHSLALMRATGAAQWQCVLLSTGFFVPDFGSGNVWVGKLVQDVLGQPGVLWHSVKWEYKALATELRRYSMRGGTYIPLTCDEEIPGWCRQCEEDLTKLKQEGVKELWPDASDYPPDAEGTAQELKPVNDSRVVMAAFKGIGPTLTNALWDAIRVFNKERLPDNPELWEPRLEQALVWATAQDSLLKDMRIPKVKGWGKKTRDSVREQMGLQDGFDMHYFVNETLDKNREMLHGDGKGEL